ncbi:MAG: 5-methyltetrahydropteroyltriglutamate--homocysteine methyltransferase, partial [Rickettsiales bacterium]|nr:5-methyltetrahydropteroyltriglutamate--homocysteine methyltransferase [Rickettsiales bacterium]
KEILKEQPNDLILATHVCRGNNKSKSFLKDGAIATYEPITELFKLPYDVFFLEYDTDVEGSFEPLKEVPSDKAVVLGLYSTKFADLESYDFIKKRFNEATKYIDPKNTALSGQCGFSSTYEGNILTEENQWIKLKHIVDTSRKIYDEISL